MYGNKSYARSRRPIVFKFFWYFYYFILRSSQRLNTCILTYWTGTWVIINTKFINYFQKNQCFNKKKIQNFIVTIYKNRSWLGNFLGRIYSKDCQICGILWIPQGIIDGRCIIFLDSSQGCCHDIIVLLSYYCWWVSVASLQLHWQEYWCFFNTNKFWTSQIIFLHHIAIFRWYFKRLIQSFYTIFLFSGIYVGSLQYAYLMAPKGSFNNYVDKMRGEGVKKYLFLSTLRV